MTKQEQKKYNDLMQEIKLVERKLDNAYEELQQKEQHFEDYKNWVKKDIENNYIAKSKLYNMIKRLDIQTENEYCDFAIMVLNVIIGG